MFYFIRVAVAMVSLHSNRNTKTINNPRTIDQKREKSTHTTTTAGINKHCSLVTFNINNPNSPARYRLTDWIKIQHLCFGCIQETHLNIKDKHHLKVKGCKSYSKQMDPRSKPVYSLNIRQKRLQTKTKQKK